MYLVKNVGNGSEFRCDAIETLTVRDGEYTPTEREFADGFRAIVNNEDGTDVALTIVYAFEGHTLLGGEPTATFESVEEPELLSENVDDDVEHNSVYSKEMYEAGAVTRMELRQAVEDGVLTKKEYREITGKSYRG